MRERLVRELVGAVGDRIFTSYPPDLETDLLPNRDWAIRLPRTETGAHWPRGGKRSFQKWISANALLMTAYVPERRQLMIDYDRKADYEKSAHEPWRWQLAAENLFEAADHLYRLHENAMQEVQENKGGVSIPVPPGFNIDSQEHYLQGKCIEVYLKCLLVSLGNRVTESGKLLAEMRKHALISLCEKAGFNINASEKGTLEKLTEAITFWGTYPIPTHFTRWRPKVEGMQGVMPVWVWGPKDAGNYLNMVHRLREQVGAQ